MDERRQKSRNKSSKTVLLCWKDVLGITRTATHQVLNASSLGLAFTFPAPLALNTVVYISDAETSTGFYSLVRHCTHDGEMYIVGVQVDKQGKVQGLPTHAENYYEFLQISPSAQPGTIHRVFRYLAGLYHPDNPETGDPERFLELNAAYEVLADSVKRAAYDEELNRKTNAPSPAFTRVDYMDGVEGELNRRVAVLAVLYRKCRSNINDARVTLIQLEQQMGFPRDYLDFTTWYLRSKKYITREDNSDFSLTASGVDFVEENYAKIPLLRTLLNSGTAPVFREPSATSQTAVMRPANERKAMRALPGAIIEAAASAHLSDPY